MLQYGAMQNGIMLHCNNIYNDLKEWKKYFNSW